MPSRSSSFSRDLALSAQPRPGSPPSPLPFAPPDSPTETTPTPSLLSRASGGTQPHAMRVLARGGARAGEDAWGGTGRARRRGSRSGSGDESGGEGIDEDADRERQDGAGDGDGAGLLRPGQARTRARTHSHRAIRDAQLGRSGAGRGSRSWRAKAAEGARALGRTGLGWAARYRRASRTGKASIWLILLINLALLLAIILITPHRIGLWLTHLAHRLRTLGPHGTGGMALLGTAVILASHPPLFGFGGSMTMIGFTYGVWPGMAVASVANLAGAALAFWSIRTFFLAWMRSFGASRSTKWSAFAHVVAARGTWLIVMLRWCPLPWAIGNGLFASIESVSFRSFMLANVLVQPRLLVPVFIGSRLSSLTGGEGDAPPDPVKKWVNVASIVVGLSVSFTTGWFIYRQTLRKMAELDPSVSADDEDAAVDILERNALLGDYSGESDDDEVEGALAQRREAGSR